MHPRSLRRARRGFTLVELLVTLAASSVAIAAILMTFIAQVHQYRRHVNLRAAQANSRMSMTVVEDAIRHAGYGVDPDRAIIAFDSFDAKSPEAQATDYPDAITVHSRQLNFGPREVDALDAASITFRPALSGTMRQGQILLVLCAGAEDWAYVTVGRTAAEGDTAVSLAAAPGSAESPLGMPGPRFRQNARLTSGCFTNPTSVQFVAVERSSYFVATYDTDGSPTTDEEPYLMLHRGLDADDDGTVDLDDASPVAADVEQLQLAYIMNTLDATPPAILGVNALDVPWGDTWATAALNPPELDARYGDPTRLSSHPANIRQIRITLVARGTAGSTFGDNYNDPGAPSTIGTALDNGTIPWRQMENLGASPSVLDPKGGYYARRVLRMSVVPKNLLMRSQFMPPSIAGGS